MKVHVSVTYGVDVEIGEVWASTVKEALEKNDEFNIFEFSQKIDIEDVTVEAIS